MADEVKTDSADSAKARLAKKKVAKKAVKPKPKAVKKDTAGKKPGKKKLKAGSEEAAEEEEEVEIIEEEDEEEAEEQVYTVKQKPKLTKTEKKHLNERRKRKDKQPTFRRQEWFRYKRLGESYRKPRGLQSKMRKNLKYRQPMARVGYGTNKEVRGLHPSGFEEVLVHNPNDLDKIDPKKQAARIGHQVGTRKRIAIEDKAEELGIRILNRGSA